VVLNIKGLGLGLTIFGLSTLALHGAFAQESMLSLESKGTAAVLRTEALQLVYASPIVVDDTLRGVAMLAELAEQGDVEAKIALGDLYLYGTLLARDWPKALQLYDSAADAGNGQGLYNYGMMLMWEERDPTLAETMLIRAGEMGVTEAWATLAEGAMYGYLGDDSISQAKFDAFAQRGVAEGVDRIAVLEATRHMRGISVESSGSRALEILEMASDQGNVEALRFLVRVVRDGNGNAILADRSRALELLEAYRPLLSALEFEQLKLTINAASSRSVADLEQFARDVKERPEVINVDFARDLIAANANALVYLLRSNLDVVVSENAIDTTDMETDASPMVGGGPMFADQNVVKNLLSSADHTIFVAGIRVAGMGAMLQTQGPFTVFAPTNAAFDALSEGTMDTLFREESYEKLSKVLGSHVVAGNISASELMTRARASRDRFYHFKTISGAALSAKVSSSGNVYIFDETGNAYRISTSDVAQSNGVIHVIDGVLMPR
jgi:uncharacterized surface protein with fasciclin (FAS1) repeats/TPR repeat protein